MAKQALSIDANSPDLARELSRCRGLVVEFSNGCWLDLNDDGGTFWGTTPYGADWACNSAEGWIESVSNWIGYWNEPRRETGDLLE